MAMTLSEAIRKGSRYSSQGFGQYFTVEEHGAACCVLGAAYLAITMSGWRGVRHTQEERLRGLLLDPEMIQRDLRAYFQELETPLSFMGATKTLEQWLYTLNDRTRWSRQRIARFLEVKAIQRQLARNPQGGA